MALDSKGRIIAAQYSKKVSVIYPKGSEAVLADNFEGKPFIRPNDLVVNKRVAFILPTVTKSVQKDRRTTCLKRSTTSLPAEK